jgi:hypothetical protein
METHDADVQDLQIRCADAERRIAELKAERDEARHLIDQMVEQVSDGNAVIERWKEAFDMALNDKGVWTWDPFIQRYDDLVSRYNELLAKWNRFVPTYNANVAPQPIGRPLDASSAQCALVLRLRRTGKSFRAVADETGLSLQTVRTIVGRDAGTDRTSARRLERIQPDKAASNRERARKRTRDALPRAMAETVEKAEKLLKEAKGLGR